jgi:hypothetical protein
MTGLRHDAASPAPDLLWLKAEIVKGLVREDLGGTPAGRLRSRGIAGGPGVSAGAPGQGRGPWHSNCSDRDWP